MHILFAQKRIRTCTSSREVRLSLSKLHPTKRPPSRLPLFLFQEYVRNFFRSIPKILRFIKNRRQPLLNIQITYKIFEAVDKHVIMLYNYLRTTVYFVFNERDGESSSFHA